VRTSAFELLEAVGRVCAGAVRLLSPEEEAIGRLLQAVVPDPLLWHQKQWCLPLGSTPTTFPFKSSFRWGGWASARSMFSARFKTNGFGAGFWRPPEGHRPPGSSPPPALSIEHVIR
jgi:hypothetical protein